MRFKNTTALAQAAGLSTLLCACATVPESGRSQLLLTDSAQEARMGLQAFQEIKRETPVSRDVLLTQRVRAVGQRIAAVVPMPNARWEFVLFEDKSANAFALPGGKVGIFTGILPIAKNDAGLATIMGHEIAHVIARHSGERMSQSVLVQVGGAALSAVLGSGSQATHDIAMQAYGLGTKVGVTLPYSRAHELEADQLGLLFMARAGYDPREALGFWRRFQDYGRRQGGKPPELLSTHPLDDRRIAQLEKLMPKALVEYERAKARRP